MAKRVLKLDFVDIVMGARADVIKEAYEARLKIDDLLESREAAYRKIAEIEQHIEEIVGVEGDFVFPAPPLPVAGIPRPVDSTRLKKVVKKPAVSEDKVENKINNSMGLNSLDIVSNGESQMEDKVSEETDTNSLNSVSSVTDSTYDNNSNDGESIKNKIDNECINPKSDDEEHEEGKSE